MPEATPEFTGLIPGQVANRPAVDAHLHGFVVVRVVVVGPQLGDAFDAGFLLAVIASNGSQRRLIFDSPTMLKPNSPRAGQ